MENNGSATAGSRVAIVIGMEDSPPWGEIFREGQVPTWVDRCVKLGIPIFLLQSRQSPRLIALVDSLIERWRYGAIVGRSVRGVLRVLDYVLPRKKVAWGMEQAIFPIIRESSPSARMFFHRRNFAFLEWAAANPRFEFVYRLHSSSFLNPEDLLRFLANLDSSVPIVGGKTHPPFSRHVFLSGAGLLFSRSAVRKILEHSSDLRRDVPEDVGISILARLAKVEFVEIARIDIEDESEVEDAHQVAQRDGIFHFRCKTGSRPQGDIAAMVSLAQKFGWVAN